jgi:PHD/YefM family antitoxin component YafN of YafNO toxin-antitoxin module
MISTVSITRAQAQLPGLVRELDNSGAVCFERRGKVAAFLISPDRMAAMVETMEVLSNRSAMKAISAHQKGTMEFKDVACLDEK